MCANDAANGEMEDDTASGASDFGGIFNRVAGGYDKEALRFFAFAADCLVMNAGIRSGDKVLDVATGTGAAALAAAQVVGPAGRVVAIDTAELMLERAQAKVQKFGVANIDLHVMDARQLEFRSGYFDAVICSQSLFLLPDMQAAIRGWARVVKPGGVIAFSSFAAAAFQPMATLLRRRVADLAGPDFGSVQELPLQRLATSDRCLQLLQHAGLVQCEVMQQQLGYHLGDAEQWWEVVCNSGFRGLIDQLQPAQFEILRKQHLQDVRPLVGADGLWMDVGTLCSRARKP